MEKEKIRTINEIQNKIQELKNYYIDHVVENTGERQAEITLRKLRATINCLRWVLYEKDYIFDIKKGDKRI